MSGSLIDMLQLTTARLLLRPLGPDDAADVQALASDERVSAHDLNIPHPFPEGGAAAWIAEQQAGWEAGTSYGFAVRTVEAGAFIGVAALKVNPAAARAELGYATIPAAWGKGYATEATQALLRFAFEGLDLERVTANCLAANVASTRVLEKLGFRLEARLQPEGPGEGADFELLFYGLMREEYRKGMREDA